MILCHNLLLTSIIITISILTALLSLPYLSSSSYFHNQYATAAHSSLGLQKSTRENGIQICCSWGNQIADGVLTYRIDDDANPQVIQAIQQATDE